MSGGGPEEFIGQLGIPINFIYPGCASGGTAS